MKFRKSLFCVLTALLLILSIAPVSFAGVEFDSESINGEYDATVFLAGSDPTSTADVRGILFSAGNTVSVGGKNEYAFLAGNILNYNGACSRDAFLAGNTLNISGSVVRDLYAAGNQLSFSGTIGRDLYAGGKSVTLSGEIGGDVYLDAESIRLMDDLTISGTLHYNSDAEINGAQQIIDQATTYENPHVGTDTDSASVSGSSPSSPLAKLKTLLFGFAGLLIIAYLLLWLTPLWEKVDTVYAGAGFGKYAAAFGIGLLVLLVLPIIAILLMITGIGLRPAFFLLFVYGAALIASPVFLGFVLGSLLWRRAFKRPCNYWAELAIGILVLRLVMLLPYASLVFGVVSTAFGVGTLTQLLGKKRSSLPAK